ncbi:centrosomal protein CEP57L1 isoform X2 [Oxyura jamaicensis]|uniref:centrosomal protein CEP57L1 isoform X2 n=1 Tax=Oxyura jamaicensis TaxID=8884 RepID=UPI0015A5A26B|nr:centrosomal protein CEP57L1 isoform X2 [Oxyura jamaicensis]
MDSESKDSFIGSFLQPPDKMIPASFAYTESKKLAAVGVDGPSISNNQAVVAALRTLQEKIHCLELEKSQAEDNLCSLSIAAAQYKKALEHESYKKDITHQELMQQRKDLSVQLNAAQSRCSLLEKQLDYMRKMVSSVELEKKMVLEQQTQLQKDQNQVELHAKLEKLEILEKECLKLSATQRIAEDKIKHLEEKLSKEEHQHKLLQDKATQLQKEFEISRILMSSLSSENECKKKNRKKNKPKKKNATMKKTCPSQFHVKAGVLPFVAGKSVSSSHSVSANVQSVLHIMKHRCPRITSRRQDGATSGISGQTALSKPVLSCSTSSTVTGSLSDLLLAIQDEMSQMSFEHQELLKQIQETQDSKVHEDLEQKLSCLVKQMNIKEEQISKLKKHQTSVQKLKRKTQKLKQEAAHVKLKYGNQKEAKEITVTVRPSMSKSRAGQKSSRSLELLKNVQKLQLTLKEDDIMWEQ